MMPCVITELCLERDYSVRRRWRGGHHEAVCRREHHRTRARPAHIRFGIVAFHADLEIGIRSVDKARRIDESSIWALLIRDKALYRLNAVVALRRDIDQLPVRRADFGHKRPSSGFHAHEVETIHRMFPARRKRKAPRPIHLVCSGMIS